MESDGTGISVGNGMADMVNAQMDLSFDAEKWGRAHLAIQFDGISGDTASSLDYSLIGSKEMSPLQGRRNKQEKIPNLFKPYYVREYSKSKQEWLVLSSPGDSDCRMTPEGSGCRISIGTGYKDLTKILPDPQHFDS